MSLCSHCGSNWWPSVLIAIAAAIGVAIGYLAQRVSEKLGQRLAGTAITVAVTVGLAAMAWSGTHSSYLLLPFAGVLVGLFHRRTEPVSVFGKRGDGDSD